MPITRSLLAVAIGLLLPLFAFAEPPSGAYELTIGGPDSLATRLRLMEGDLEPDPECVDHGTYEICQATTVHTNAAGEVSGGWTHTYTGSKVGVVTFVIDGTVKAVPGLAKSKLILTPQGTIQDESVGPTVFSGRGKAFCQDEVTDGEPFRCEAKIRLCSEDIFLSDCDTGFAALEVAQQQAAWVFAVNLSTAENGAITGTGRATLSNGVVIDFTAKGKYSSKSDTANVNLKGTGLAIKSKVTLKKVRATGGELVSGRVKFKVAAQLGVYQIPIPPP